MNARKHGGYSALHPICDSAFLDTARFAARSGRLLQSTASSDGSSLHVALAGNRLVLSQIDRTLARANTLREMTFWSLQMFSIIGANRRLASQIVKLEGRQPHLHALAPRVSALIGCEFALRGIPRHPVFVPLKLGNFHANSPSSITFLTDDQWGFIQDCLKALGLNLDTRRSPRGRKRRFDNRFLLQGILLKLAFKVRWCDVPRLMSACSPNSPPWLVRIGQEYYRRLYNDVRMLLIYDLLYKHLLQYGHPTLGEFVESAAFRVRGNCIVFSYTRGLTWEKFTSLLFLQRVWFNQNLARRVYRHRRRFGTFLRQDSALHMKE